MLFQMIKICLASTSEIKKNALQKFLNNVFKGIDITIDCFKIDCDINPEQPFGYKETSKCCMNRYEILKSLTKDVDYDGYVAIESGIAKDEITKKYNDVVAVYLNFPELLNTSIIMYDYNEIFKYQCVFIDDYLKFVNAMPKNSDLGYDITYGEFLKTMDSSINQNNWFGTREEQIYSQLNYTFDIYKNRDKNNYYSFVVKKASNLIKDFPKEGILFMDLFPIFEKPCLMNVIHEHLDTILEKNKIKIDYVAGPELRGTLMALSFSRHLSIDMLPIRKSGKLPPPVINVKYEKEYGFDVLEIKKIDLTGKKILLTDDILATGGSLKACIELIKSLGGEIVLIYVISDIEPLRELASKTLGNEYKKVNVLLKN